MSVLSPTSATSLEKLITDIYTAESNTLKAEESESYPFSCIQLCVDAPKLDLHWCSARGYTDVSQTDIATDQHPMRIASVSKTFVAVAILRLWEQQKLDLDESINAYICSQHQKLLAESAYKTQTITIRHLLSHTSGLFNYADSDEFAAEVAANHQRHWTRSEQLQLAMVIGKPYGAAGEVYRYSDTGYILLGEIIEQVTGQPLALALRNLVNYEGLGLHTTWLEVDEPEPLGVLPRVHQYVKEQDFFAVNGSNDIYGGGGLISTVGDMARFMRGLFSHQIYDYPDTLHEMLTTVHAPLGGPGNGAKEQIPEFYRLGLDGGSHGKVYQHTGYFGTCAAYVPQQDLVFSLSVNQNAYYARVVSDVYGALGV